MPRISNELSTCSPGSSQLILGENRADLWIDSGKSGDDLTVDNPADRHVSYSPSVPPSAIVPGLSCSAAASIAELFHQLVGYEARRQEIKEDGTLYLEEVIFGFPDELPRLPRRREEALVFFGMKVAMYWFERLLDSHWSRHLARCDNCLAHFEYERAPKKPRKSGVYCSAACARLGGKKRAERSRRHKRDLMIETADAAWETWQPSHRWPTREEYVLHAVNRKHGTDWKRNWIAHKLKEKVEKNRKATSDGLPAR